MKKSKTPVAQQLKRLYYRKQQLQARVAEGQVLRRREAEELRVSASELQKFKLLSTCLVPLGNILIAPIYFNPRRFWPTMLWDLENHVKYREQENLERKVFQKKLENVLSDAVRAQGGSPQSLTSVTAPPLLSALLRNVFSDSGSLALQSLPRDHLEQLAASHNICAFTFLYSWSPTSLLVKWLTARGHELIQDDLLLLAEGSNSIDELATHEVIDACLRRGILSSGVYANLVLQNGTEEDEEDKDADENENETKDTTDQDIVNLLKSNWDEEKEREKLRQWISTVSRVDGLLSFNQNVSLYLHSSTLGLTKTMDN